MHVELDFICSLLTQFVTWKYTIKLSSNWSYTFIGKTQNFKYILHFFQNPLYFYYWYLFKTFTFYQYRKWKWNIVIENTPSDLNTEYLYIWIKLKIVVFSEIVHKLQSQQFRFQLLRWLLILLWMVLYLLYYYILPCISIMKSWIVVVVLSTMKFFYDSVFTKG